MLHSELRSPQQRSVEESAAVWSGTSALFRAITRNRTQKLKALLDRLTDVASHLAKPAGASEATEFRRE